MPAITLLVCLPTPSTIAEDGLGKGGGKKLAGNVAKPYRTAAERPEDLHGLDTLL